MSATPTSDYELALNEDAQRCSNCDRKLGENAPVIREKKLRHGNRIAWCNVPCFLDDMAKEEKSVWIVESGDNLEGYQTLGCVHMSMEKAIACAERQAKDMGYEKQPGRELVPYWKKSPHWISASERELDP